MTDAAILAIRPATQDDELIVARLAALDSAPVPAGDLLLGVVDGRPLAALSMSTAAVVADPFACTAELVGLLRQRAARLQAVATPRRRLGVRARRQAARAT